MTKETLVASKKNSVGWYEEVVQVRGCHLTLDDIKAFYRVVHEINRSFGEQAIARLQPDPEMTEEQWKEYKQFLLDDAFRITVTISGQSDSQKYDESEAIFSDPNIPMPIKSIYFTNATAFQRNSNGERPENEIRVYLDFSKPELFDPTPLVSAATPNKSSISINAKDITFFNAVSKAIDKTLTKRKVWYGPIHRNFAYDFGLWFGALPITLYFSTYFMDFLIPIGSKLELFRWPFFAYIVGVCVLFYRALIAYTKWAFPVNLLTENKDKALKHRIILGTFTTWLFWQIASTLYGIVVP